MNSVRRLAIPMVVVAVLIGIGLGLFLGWQVWPVTWYDTDPSDLRLAHQITYVVMAADSLAVTGDVDLARQRLFELTDEEADWQWVGDLVEEAAVERDRMADVAGALRLRRMAQSLSLPQASAEPVTARPPQGVIPAGTPNWAPMIIGLVAFLAGLVIVIWLLLRILRRPAPIVQGPALRPPPGRAAPVMAEPIPAAPPAAAIPVSPRPRPVPDAIRPRAKTPPPPTVTPSRDEEKTAALADEGAPAPWPAPQPSPPTRRLEEARPLTPAAMSPLEDQEPDWESVDLREEAEEAALAEEKIEDEEVSDEELVQILWDEEEEYAEEASKASEAPPAVAPAPAEPAPAPPPKPRPAPAGALAVFEAEYRYGDDDFDCSFSIEAPDGEFLGECGVGVGDVLEVREAQQIDAFEVWLFDKGDIRTVSQIVVSDLVHDDDALRARLESKGQPTVAQTGLTFDLETLSLRVRATVQEYRYREDSELPDAVFEYLRVEMVVLEAER